jgi:WD40 repeat protein
MSTSVFGIQAGTLLSGPSRRHNESVVTVAFTPNSTFYAMSADGKWIAAFRDNRTTIHVRDLQTGRPAASFEAHTGFIGSVAIFVRQQTYPLSL